MNITYFVCDLMDFFLTWLNKAATKLNVKITHVWLMLNFDEDANISVLLHKSIHDSRSLKLTLFLFSRFTVFLLWVVFYFSGTFLSHVSTVVWEGKTAFSADRTRTFLPTKWFMTIIWKRKWKCFWTTNSRPWQRKEQKLSVRPILKLSRRLSWMKVVKLTKQL